VDETIGVRKEYNSPACQDAYTTIANFRGRHGGHDSLQYADDFLKGNMTAEEYKMVQISHVPWTACILVAVGLRLSQSCSRGVSAHRILPATLTRPASLEYARISAHESLAQKYHHARTAAHMDSTTSYIKQLIY
jgi:hypothetical protein